MTTPVGKDEIQNFASRYGALTNGEELKTHGRRYRQKGASLSVWRDITKSFRRQVVAYEKDGPTRRVVESINRTIKWTVQPYLVVGGSPGMAFSVEGRYPFLDHELIELCLSFDSSVLFHKGWTKWPLRCAMDGVLINDIIARKSKFGYVTPQETWLYTDLREKIKSWLSQQNNPLWDIVEPKSLKKVVE
ncbi:MAG: hypothetical protein IH848_06025, partial [Acidobacteria bacterium]|nr:hypothetical protein [Acidobacteriota bacterium]